MFGPRVCERPKPGKEQAKEWMATLQGRIAYYHLKTKQWSVQRLCRLRELLKQHPSLRYSLFACVGLLAFCLAAGTFVLTQSAAAAGKRDIQSVSRMEESTNIFDRNGKLIYQFHQKQRTVVPLSQISKEMRDAILAVEDHNFYRHSGYEGSAIVRAAFANLVSGRVTQGGSTLTQQLAKNVFLNSERSYRRKIQEFWLARRIERNYSKDQILEMYANRIYFGSGYYGVEAAAQGYFGKSAAQLSLEEAATLAGIAKAPGLYSPHISPSSAGKRRDLVLSAMARCGFISARRAAAAKQQPLVVKARTDDSEGVDYALDYVKDQLQAMFGYKKIFNGGLRVYTSIDSAMQKSAETAVEHHLAGIEHQRSFAADTRAQFLGRHKNITGGEERPDYLQGALVSMDVHTGEIYALVGGRNFNESKFNRAAYAKRQPGSAFKPIVYAAALHTGMTPATIIDGSREEYWTGDAVYRPANGHSRQYGSVTLRVALRNSINTVAVQVGKLLGPQTIIRTARDFGMEGNLPPVLSLPLGTGEVTLMEMVRAYSAFPNQGRVTQPRIIRRVETRDGQVLYEGHPVTRYAIDPQTAFLMTTMLTDAVDYGTGAGVRGAGFRLPAGGKTGTTNDFRDAWFIGFTPDVVTGVWVGFDEPRKIIRNGYGATLAVPIWADFMKHCFNRPSVTGFLMPAGIERASICAESGLLATPACDNVHMEYFPGGSVPQSSCDKHGITEPSIDPDTGNSSTDPKAVSISISRLPKSSQ
ncbi:MAG TPA: PBP1A family penicillin-binding protein [Acidobacteriota bacterium]